MAEEQWCKICKIRFIEALWCGMENCPCVQLKQPTAEMRQQLKMDEKSERAI